MKRIILCLFMFLSILFVYSCTTVPNGGGSQIPTPNPGNPFEPYLNIDFGRSNLDYFTCYNKAYPKKFNYDLSLVKLLYFYDENKYISPDKSKYTIEITNGEGEEFPNLTPDMDEGVYSIVFVYNSLDLTIEIIFEVINQEIEDYYLDFSNSNLDYQIYWNKEFEEFDFDLQQVKFIVVKDSTQVALDDTEYLIKTYNSLGKEVDFNSELSSGQYTIKYSYLNNPNVECHIEFIVEDEFNLTDYDGGSYEISFYHALGQSYNNMIQEIIDDFEIDIKDKYNIDVTVKQASMGDYDTLYQTIKNSIRAGVQPTIAQTYVDHTSSYLKADAVADLIPYITNSKYGLEGDADDCYGYVDGCFNEGFVYDTSGACYSLPFMKSTEVLYYNASIFEKYGWNVPTTWDEVVTICEAWKKTSEYQNALKQGKKVGGLGIDSTANLFMTLTKQWGGEVSTIDEDGHVVYLFDSQYTKDSLNWFLNEYNKGNLTTYFDLEVNYCSDALLNGQIIMSIGSSAGAIYHVARDNSFVTGVAPHPQISGTSEDEKKVILQGTNVTLFKQQEKIEEVLGWLFIKYLTNYDSTLKIAMNSNYLPIRKDVLNSIEYQEYLNDFTDPYGNVNFSEKVRKEAFNIALSQSSYLYSQITFDATNKARIEFELIILNITQQQDLYTIDKAIKEALENLNK